MKLFNLLKKTSIGTDKIKSNVILGRLRRIGREPFIDWVLMLTVSSILVIILVWMSYFKYIDFNNSLNEQISVTHPKSENLIDTKALDNILEMYNSRARTMDMLRRGYAGPGDPSL